MDEQPRRPEFEPTTDFPEFIDADDSIVAAGPSAHDAEVQRRRRFRVRIFAVVAAVLLVGGGFGLVRTVIAVAVSYALFMTGIAVIGAFARPVPDAPPPGELRRVKLTYRCEICGTELRLTLANDQVPEPPRHCSEPMMLTTNLDDVL
ncbi:MAG: hypothetical protein HKN03_07800 [Acidimicrobiales bacterium]|nr:hypothetical protein [Acidimicrobiales bacterium]